MLNQYIKKEPEVVKYMRSSSVYREQYQEWFEDESPSWQHMSNNKKPNRNEVNQGKAQGGNIKQQESDEENMEKQFVYSKSLGHFIQGKLEIQISENSEIHFYELILKLERLYLEMQRNKVFEMPKICHPLLLHAYLLGIKNTKQGKNRITKLVKYSILDNKVLRKYFESDVYLKKYLEAQLYPQENQPSVTQLIKLFTKQLYQQEFHQDNLNEVDSDLVTDDYHSYEDKAERFILKIIKKDKSDPKVRDYLIHYPLQRLGNNILVAQLKICFNYNQCIRIPIFAETAWFDFKLIQESSKQTIQDKIAAGQGQKQNLHSESALISRLHEDLFRNNGVLIIRGLEQSIEIKKISYIRKFELEIASMKEVCKECRMLLRLDNIKYTNELQGKIKDINFEFQITENLPLYKRAMFMQFDDKNAPDAMNIEQPIFRQESIPIGLFSRYMFKYRYLKKQALENYKGDIKTPMKQIQLSHTYYLSTSYSNSEKTWDDLYREAKEIALAQEQAEVEAQVQKEIQQVTQQEIIIQQEVNENQFLEIEQKQVGQNIPTVPFKQDILNIETEQPKEAIGAELLNYKIKDIIKKLNKQN